MKLKLMLLSDIMGFDNAPWIKIYSELLDADYELIFYDSRKLAGIEKPNLSKKEVHSSFINGGIETAVNKLLELETTEINCLAFSIGGTIAWKAALQGLKIKTLFAVSSTRLRYESKRPNCDIQLTFGEDDDYKPDKNWADKLNLNLQISANGNHEIYKNPFVIHTLCQQIKAQHKTI